MKRAGPSPSAPLPGSSSSFSLLRRTRRPPNPNASVGPDHIPDQSPDHSPDHIPDHIPDTNFGAYPHTHGGEVSQAQQCHRCGPRHAGNDVLLRDLTDLVIKSGTYGCVVLAGTLHSAYSDAIVAFTRGQSTSSAVQIDHAVALSDAWQKGAQKLSREKREQLANDFLNLRAIDGPTNARKSDHDVASWLPPRKIYRCGFVARQIALKKKYGLWVTAAERDAMTRVLSKCPGQGLPRSYPIKLGGGTE